MKDTNLQIQEAEDKPTEIYIKSSELSENYTEEVAPKIRAPAWNFWKLRQRKKIKNSVLLVGKTNGKTSDFLS